MTRTNGATLTAYMLVNNVTQLQAMKDRPSGYYALGKDIYANGANGSLNTATWNGGKGFVPVGTNAQTFSGRFFGDDHKIIGLHINDNTLLNAGLFGVIGANGRISHVGLESATVTGGGDAGILAGQNFGNITKAYAVGSVTGDSAGGLTGRNWGTIAQAFSSGSVTGLLGGSVGGLTSNNSGSISNSFSTSTVNLTFDDCGPLCQIGAAGALVAANMGGATITNSYATGLLTLVGTASPTSNGLMGMGIDFGSTTSSHWNTQTTGQATSPGGTGKTTAQMTQQGTFVGWDFGDIWNIDEGVGFPYLKWSNLVFNDPRVVLTPTPGGSSTSEGNRVSQIADICSLAPVVCRPELAPAPPYFFEPNQPIEYLFDPNDIKKSLVDAFVDNKIINVVKTYAPFGQFLDLVDKFSENIASGTPEKFSISDFVELYRYKKRLAEMAGDTASARLYDELIDKAKALDMLKREFMLDSSGSPNVKISKLSVLEKIADSKVVKFLSNVAEPIGFISDVITVSSAASDALDAYLTGKNPAGAAKDLIVGALGFVPATLNIAGAAAGLADAAASLTGSGVGDAVRHYQTAITNADTVFKNTIFSIRNALAQGTVDIDTARRIFESSKTTVMSSVSSTHNSFASSTGLILIGAASGNSRKMDALNGSAKSLVESYSQLGFNEIIRASL